MHSEIVTREIPKKYRTFTGPTSIEWAECFFGRRMMPNGYEVTLCGIEWNGQLFLGAAARAPHDLRRDNAKGYALAMGRARSQAFCVATGNSPLLITLVAGAQDAGTFCGILSMTADASKLSVERWFGVASHNAEEHALELELHRITVRHGHRYRLLYELNTAPEEVIL